MIRAGFEVPENLDQTQTAYELPHGKVWQRRAFEVLEAHENDKARYVIRELTGAPSHLIAGAVLQHSAGIEHPRCWGPNFWKRVDGKLWMATIRPLGEPAQHTIPEQMSWSEALELWRPLAEAIARGHRRGIVHGQLTPWTIWYDAEAERLTAIDAGCWVGDPTPEHHEERIWWAPELRVDPIARITSPFVDVYGLARLLLWLVLPRDQSLAERPSYTGLPAFAIPALDRCIKSDPGQRLGRVEELIAALSPSLMEEYDERMQQEHDDEITSILTARISQKHTIDHPRMGEGLKFYLNIPKATERKDEQVGAFFYSEVDRSLFESLRWAWDGAQLNLLDARVVTDSKGRQFITSHRETLPVLEPSFPISVSNVLKAERCTSRFLVDERDSGSSSKALVLGNLVHGMLEDLTGASPKPFAQSFDERASKLRMDMLAAGMSDRDLEIMRNDAVKHYDNIERFTRSRIDDLSPAPKAVLAPTPRWPDEDSVYNQEPHKSVGWSGRHIEATRYSPLYGLEGRIDLATEDDSAGVQIIELKSGSAWDGHLSQVRCYTLLWAGLAKTRELEVSGYVLYSRYGRLSAVPMEDISRERRILRARNELVACHRSYVDPTYSYTPPHFMQEPRNCNAPSCKFRRDRCREQTSVLGLDPEVSAESASAMGGVWSGFSPELVARAWEYYRHMDRLIEMERWTQHSAMGMLFDQARLGDRIKEHRACTQMKLDEVDLERGLVTFRGQGAQIFGQGSAVLAHHGDLHHGHVLRGYVEESSPTHVTLRSQAAQIAATLDAEDWILDNLPVRIGVRHAKRALYTFMRRRENARIEALLAPSDARELFEPSEELREAHATTHADVPLRRRLGAAPALNARQREAVDAALYSPMGALIQGPPGTGKTTVIARIVRELVARGERVLVCAQTNTAVDTILSKVVDAGVRSFLRVGHMARSASLAATLEADGADPELFFTKNLARRCSTLEELNMALTTCPVFGATTHATTSAPLFEFFARQIGTPAFDVVIVDEASQITEPMTLAALNRAKRFVLVGDHKQLPPIVQAEQALTAYFEGDFDGVELDRDESSRPSSYQVPPQLTQIGIAGLDRSLFERLVERLPHVMLEEQYRMNRAIMSHSNRAFYGGKLHAHASVAGHKLATSPAFLETLESPIKRRLDPDIPLLFEHIQGEDRGRSNRAEADAIVDTIITMMHQNAFLSGGEHGPKPSIGVISPFRAQVQLIRSELVARLGERAWQVDVDTVERYQGGERDIILVSFVKTERAGEFLSDLRRLNVTLTRARKKLVCFGHYPCLVLNPRLRPLLQQDETRLFGLDQDLFER